MRVWLLCPLLNVDSQGELQGARRQDRARQQPRPGRNFSASVMPDVLMQLLGRGQAACGGAAPVQAARIGRSCSEGLTSWQPACTPRLPIACSAFPAPRSPVWLLCPPVRRPVLLLPPVHPGCEGHGAQAGYRGHCQDGGERQGGRVCAGGQHAAQTSTQAHTPQCICTAQCTSCAVALNLHHGLPTRTHSTVADAPCCHPLACAVCCASG